MNLFSRDCDPYVIRGNQARQATDAERVRLEGKSNDQRRAAIDLVYGGIRSAVSACPDLFQSWTEADLRDEAAAIVGRLAR